MKASDIMIERYGIDDARRYKDDHQLLVGGALYMGVSAGLFVAVILGVLEFGFVIDVLAVLLILGFICLGVSLYILRKLEGVSS